MAAPSLVNVNIGDLGMYTGGFTVPPGKYAMEFSVQMWEPADAQAKAKWGGAKLGVLAKFHSLTDPSRVGEHAFEQFYGMGSQADKSFAPNPVTGKGLVAVPGASGATLNNSTNWFVLYKSMLDAGLPLGVFSNDFTVLDGMHVTTALVDEPAERAGFQSRTSEAATERKANKICVVSEIHDDGKPWEGTGGIPTAATGTAPTGKVPKTPATTKTTPAPAAPVTESSIDILDAASDVASGILESNLKGMKRLLFRTTVFSNVGKKYGDDMSQAVQNEVLNVDEKFSQLLAGLGYKVKGADIVPVS